MAMRVGLEAERAGAGREAVAMAAVGMAVAAMGYVVVSEAVGMAVEEREAATAEEREVAGSEVEGSAVDLVAVVGVGSAVAWVLEEVGVGDSDLQAGLLGAAMPTGS